MWTGSKQVMGNVFVVLVALVIGCVAWTVLSALYQYGAQFNGR